MPGAKTPTTLVPSASSAELLYGSSDPNPELNFQSYRVIGHFTVAVIWLTVSSVAGSASLFSTVELEESSLYIAI